MDRQEALDRLRLIDRMVNENRGSALENGKSWMWVSGLMSALLLAVECLRQHWIPEFLRWPARIGLLGLVIYTITVEWQRYQRFRRNPTLAYRVYMALMLGSLYLMIPFEILQWRGLLPLDAGFALLYGLMALTMAVFRPLLALRWLDGFALFWLAGACALALRPEINPLLFSAAMMMCGGFLPGYLLYRTAGNNTAQA